MDNPFKRGSAFNIVLSPPVFKPQLLLPQLLEKIAAG
jgi:hypothetical protein